MTVTLLFVVALVGQSPDSPASAAETFRLINAARAQHGLPAYRPSVILGSAARVQSLDQARSGHMKHRGSDGSQCWDRARRLGYRGSTVSENVGWNQRSAQEIVHSWMNSPGHRAAILSRTYTECGVACEVGSRGPYWTSVFGRPNP